MKKKLKYNTSIKKRRIVKSFTKSYKARPDNIIKSKYNIIKKFLLH